VKDQQKSGEEEIMKIKEVTKVFLKELKIEEAIRSMIFDFSKTQMSLKTINTYNRIKEILFKCGTEDMDINIHILSGLVKEIKLNIEIGQRGLGSSRLKRTLQKQQMKLASKRIEVTPPTSPSRSASLKDSPNDKI